MTVASPTLSSAVARYGVVGHPVAHSLSPRIHAAFARQAGISIAYDRIPAAPDAFAKTIADFFSGGGRGLNVTLPFKVEARERCGARVTPRAARAGAVNWLASGDDGPAGDNTDGIGLVRDLQRLVGPGVLADAHVLVIGAGGAARGVLGPLRDAVRGTLRVAARDTQKARRMLAACALDGVVTACGFADLDASWDIVVNATSASLSGERLPLPAALFADAALAYDMMYGAQALTFLDQARDAGARAGADGLGMLVEQAAESFRLWHGVMPAVQPVIDDLRGGTSVS